MEQYCCFVNNEKYFFTYGDLKYNRNGKTYSGVAEFWKEGCERERDTVPFYTKEDEIDLTHKKIQEQIGPVSRFSTK